MRSKAHLKGHPLHPILIVFPVAFFTGSLLFDISALITGSHLYWQVGKYFEISGIIGAFAAAIPGIIDYSYTVPPDSSAKSRAKKHGLINTVMIILFITAFLLRDDDSSGIIVAIEAAGVILLSIAGWMGGTLVHRNQIGVDIRYADAGKWNEAYFEQFTDELEVAAADELQPDQMKLLHTAGKRIVLGRTSKGYVAFNDRCTHRGGPLAAGAMICGTVQCPWHGSQFDVETGEVKAGPACEKIVTYKAEESNGKIYLKNE